MEGSCRLHLQTGETPRRSTPQALEQGLGRPLAMSHYNSKIEVGVVNRDEGVAEKWCLAHSVISDGRNFFLPSPNIHRPTFALLR